MSAIRTDQDGEERYRRALRRYRIGRWLSFLSFVIGLVLMSAYWDRYGNSWSTVLIAAVSFSIWISAVQWLSSRYLGLGFIWKEQRKPRRVEHVEPPLPTPMPPMLADSPGQVLSGRGPLRQRLLRVLAEADPIETGQGYEFCLGEYGLEAGEIEREMTAGETLEDATAKVFRSTCGMDLQPDQIAQIRQVYDRLEAEDGATLSV